MRHQRAAQPLKLDGPEAARVFFADCFAESDPARECLWVAHVDDRMRCIHLSRHDGDACGTDLPIRTIVAETLKHDSAGLLLAHNHPSGDPRPSASDCVATRQLTTVTQAIGCRLIDHLIFAGERSTSLRSLGWL